MAFPDSIYSQRELENLPGLEYDENNKKTLYAEDIFGHGTEITAIESLLGQSIADGFATVAERIASKQDSITGAASSIVSSNLTALRALVTDSSGKVAASGTTSTELGYLNNVTSDIQGQLNNKMGIAGQPFIIYQEYPEQSTMNNSTPYDFTGNRGLSTGTLPAGEYSGLITVDFLMKNSLANAWCQLFINGSLYDSEVNFSSYVEADYLPFKLCKFVTGLTGSPTFSFRGRRGPSGTLYVKHISMTCSLIRTA